MHLKNSKTYKNILAGLMVVILLCFANTTGMASVGNKIPSTVKKYIGKTYWTKTHYFGDDVQPFVYEVNTNKKILLNKKEFFTKLKVIGYKEGGDYNNFIAIINGKTCFVDETIIIASDPKDYSSFTKDPKTIFKWSKSVWDKLCTLNPFIGMTPDMLKMIRGNYSSKSKITMKNGALDKWVYSSDLGNEYFYFKNGKLYNWIG